jgi:SAM-dependent methyltransferase
MINGPLFPRFRDNGREVFTLTDIQTEARDRIRAKVLDGRYAAEHIPCPLCEGGDNQPLSEKDAYGLPMRAVVCRDCALVYTNPRLTQVALAEMYKTEYSDLDRVLPSSKDYFELEKKKGAIIFALLEKHGFLPLIEGSLIVDVGCGAGGVLGYFKDKGFDVLGCDLVPKNLKYGVEIQGLELHYGGLEAIQGVIADRGRRLGLVIYEQVFEHLTAPKTELRKLRTVMPDDALLYVGVPGLRNIEAHYGADLIRYLQLPHLLHFDLSRLNAMLAVCGFAAYVGDETVRALYRPASTAELDRADYRDILQFLEVMEKRRSSQAIGKALRELPLTCARALKKAIRRLPLSERGKADLIEALKRIRNWLLR